MTRETYMTAVEALERCQEPCGCAGEDAAVEALRLVLAEFSGTASQAVADAARVVLTVDELRRRASLREGREGVAA